MPALRRTVRLALLVSLALPLAAACVSSSAATDRGAQTASSAAPMTGATRPSSGTDVLRMMHDRYAGRWYTSLSFRQETEIHLPNDSVVRQTWWEVGKIPGFLRIDRLANDGKNVIIFRGDTTYARRNGGPFQSRAGRNVLMTVGFDVYVQPVEQSARVLTEEGYDLTKVSEGTWEGRPVWIVGAMAGDTASTQFWVDQQRLVYVRSLEKGMRDATSRAEVVFGKYEPLAGGWIAKEVTVSEGGKVLQREVYSDVKANVPVSADFFDPSKL